MLVCKCILKNNYYNNLSIKTLLHTVTSDALQASGHLAAGNAMLTMLQLVRQQ